MKPNIYQLIPYISNMDINKLQEILSDDCNYMGLSKTHFIAKLADVFDHFRFECKDTQLIPSNGICCEKDCSNFGGFGVCFKGNKSQKYLSLIFGTDKDTDKVNTIFDCQNFQLTTGEILNESLEIEIVMMNNMLILYQILSIISCYSRPIKRMMSCVKMK